MVRFYLPVVVLILFAAYSSSKLIFTHVDADVTAPKYDFYRSLPGRRGSIYDKGGSNSPLAKSVPVWEYRLDPVNLTNAVVRRKGELPRKPKAILRTISDVLHIDYNRLVKMAQNSSNRYQYLAQSSDPDAHKILADSSLVAGVVIEDRQVRQYLHGRRLSHVIGSINAYGEPSAGLELKYNKELSGVPGLIHGRRDARGRELYDKRIDKVAPVPGADIHLTVDHNLQFEVESALKWGVREYGAGSGWCVILDAKTAAVLAMASLPDFDPVMYGRVKDTAKINRVVNYTYEPGSVMKVVTAAGAVEAGIARPDSLFNTDRYEEGYYMLPGDGSHVWEPRMSLKDAIVHSSNIVIGKLGVMFGQTAVYDNLRAFGFGERTGVELPAEERGNLGVRGKWDKATWSRAPIGQAVAVTALQLASAYQAIANDGVRMKPYIIDYIEGSDGNLLFRHENSIASRPISAATSRKVREMMLDVASPAGTARRAAIRGYSIAGKTGTAQKSAGRRGYIPGLYRATFCGIVPSGVVSSEHPPRLVILVTLDFDQRTKFHQGGNSAGPVFKRIATAALRYLCIEPDKPDELMGYADDDEFDRIMDSRAEGEAIE